jgi:hypothetical protein
LVTEKSWILRRKGRGRGADISAEDDPEEVGGVRDSDRSEPASDHGNFFAIDARVWPLACALGLNAAVSYLVLATGTCKKNRQTTWSVNAVEAHTGISRLKAKKAIAHLGEFGLIGPVERRVPGPPGPQYLLARAHESAPAIAALWEKEGRQSPSRSELAEPAWIWLPKTLVTGVDGETPPVELLRQTSDVMKLRLLVELYGDQHLRVEGGVRRDVVCEIHRRHDLGARGEFRVWGFNAQPEMKGWWHRSAAPHRRAQGGPEEADDLWARLGALRKLGLLEFVPHLVEGLDNDAEILHVYGMGDTDSLEDQLGRARARERAV